MKNLEMILSLLVDLGKITTDDKFHFLSQKKEGKNVTVKIEMQPSGTIEGKVVVTEAIIF